MGVGLPDRLLPADRRPGSRHRRGRARDGDRRIPQGLRAPGGDLHVAWSGPAWPWRIPPRRDALHQERGEPRRGPADRALRGSTAAIRPLTHLPGLVPDRAGRVPRGHPAGGGGPADRAAPRASAEPHDGVRGPRLSLPASGTGGEGHLAAGARAGGHARREQPALVPPGGLRARAGLFTRPPRARWPRLAGGRGGPGSRHEDDGGPLAALDQPGRRLSARRPCRRRGRRRGAGPPVRTRPRGARHRGPRLPAPPRPRAALEPAGYRARRGAGRHSVGAGGGSRATPPDRALPSHARRSRSPRRTEGERGAAPHHRRRALPRDGHAALAHRSRARAAGATLAQLRVRTVADPSFRRPRAAGRFRPRRRAGGSVAAALRGHGRPAARGSERGVPARRIGPMLAPTEPTLCLEALPAAALLHDLSADGPDQPLEVLVKFGQLFLGHWALDLDDDPVSLPSLDGLARHDVLPFLVSVAAMMAAYSRASCRLSNTGRLCERSGDTRPRCPPCSGQPTRRAPL